MGRGLPKKYAKMGFKEGWKQYKKDHPKKGSRASSKLSKKRKGRTPRKAQSRRSSGMRFGMFGLRGLVVGGVLTAATKFLIRTRAPQVGAYTPALASVGAGVVGSATMGTGKSLIGFGLVEAVSEFIYDLVSPGGVYTLPGITSKTAPGGYDY